MKNYVLECCVDSVESAINAERGGATRLELCGNLIIGGTSPSLQLYEMVRRYCNLPIRVLLRPRFGDFLYSNYEFAIIKEEVRCFRQAGAEGIVIGCLTAEGDLDVKRMETLICESGSMGVALHRAFDLCKDPIETLRVAKVLGIQTILTSGQRNTCIEGMDLISTLIGESKAETEILVGAGVNAEVIRNFLENTKATSFHMSGKRVLESQMEYRKLEVNMGLSTLSEYEIWRTDRGEVAGAVEVLEGFL